MLLKEERFKKILEMIDAHGIIKVSDITQDLRVTEMTVRRDLKILEEDGLLIRIHGGAKRKQEDVFKELTHSEKKLINIEEKKHIAKIAASLIKEKDIIYIGPGTTCELIYDFINVSNVRVITNSISVFTRFMDDKRFELILAGGRLRHSTGGFVGTFTKDMLTKIRVKAAFIGANGIYENNVTSSNEEEGLCNKTALNNAVERYILSDNSKINKEDFYSFYDLNDVTAMITDANIDPKIKKKYEKFVKIIN